MFFSISKIFELLVLYRYIIIFPISILEGPIISILCGFLVSNNIVNLYAIFVLLLLGDFVGDTMYYSMGRFGGIPFINKWGRYFGLEENGLINLKDYFKKHELPILLLGKTHPLGSITLATAGFTKMNYSRFLFIVMSGTVVKTSILLAIGYYFGKAYVLIDNYLAKGAIIFSLILVAGTILYFLNKRKKI